jgi:hypothetical protein
MSIFADHIPLRHSAKDIKYDNTTSGMTATNAQAAIDEVSTTIAGVIDLQGDLDASTNPNYPAATKGHAYVITVAGKVGGASGKAVNVGDLVVAKADNAGGDEAAVGASWFVLESNRDQATETSLGVAELATQVETDAETDDERIVTPLKLGAWFPTKSHTALQDIGTTSHADLDLHVGSTSNPHSVTKTQVGLGNVTDDAQIAKSIIAAKGDLIVGTADDTPSILTVGATNGHVLTIDSATATGLKWAAGGGSGDNDLNPSPASDHTASATASATMTAGEAVVFGDLCYVKSDGKLWKADASAAATMPGMYMALASISADATGSFLLQGFVRDDSWSWTVGGMIYASETAGGLTQTAPSTSGAQVQALGSAISATVIDFRPSPNLFEMP